MSKCNNKKCGCYDNKYPFICVNNQDIPGCEDRKLIASNTTHPQGYEGVTIITPEVNQISAYKEHLEFVNSTEPLSGIKKHTVLRIAQSFIDGITAGFTNFLGRNVGSIGAEIYKGPTVVGSTTYQDFRKIAGSTSIDVEQIGDNIVPSVDEVWLQEQMPNIPTIPVQAVASVGGGLNIYQGMTGTTANIATLEEGDGITLTFANGKYKISAPQAPDDTIKSFYVNANYVGTGNGSILRPYKKYVDALKAVVGTGTIINPQYKKAKIILQSSVVVTLADLVASSVLENRLSVNTTTTVSEDNYSIIYEGLIDYPVSTEFLKTKAISTSYVGEVYLTFDNVTVYTETVKGLLNLETHQTANFEMMNNFYNVTVESKFNPSAYNSFTPPVLLFGQNVKGQTTAISNTTPTVYIHGTNNSQVGNYNFRGYFKVVGTSQTFVRVQETAANFEELILEHNGYFLSVDDMTTKNPKAGIYRLEVIDAYTKIENLQSKEEMSGVGGNDAFIRFEDNGTFSGADLIIDSGSVYHARFNKIYSLDNSTTKVQTISNCDFSRVDSLQTALYNENGASPVRGVNMEKTNIRDVELSSVCGISIGAIQAFINGFEYSTSAGFINDAAAIAAGLIPNSIYYNTTDSKFKKL